MKFDVDDKNRCRLVCVKFHLNRCRFAAAVAKCLGGSLFWDTVYIHTNLYSAENREDESEALAQDDYTPYTVKVDRKRWNFRWRLKVDRVSIERMCAGKEFQVEGADTDKAREEKLLVIPAGLVRRFVLEERKDLCGR